MFSVWPISAIILAAVFLCPDIQKYLRQSRQVFQILETLAPIPVANLRGLGRQMQKIFRRRGISTVKQLRITPLPPLHDCCCRGW